MLSAGDRSDAIPRASSEDLMTLASGGGRAPMQVGAVVLLEATGDPADLVRLLGSRLPAVPRLRQRLVPVGPGLGRPVWLDAADFSLAEHVRVEPDVRGGMPGVLDLAARMLMTPLAPDRPLWAAAVVPGVEPGVTALVFVLHHVLADGIGGLRILGLLASGHLGGRPFPAPPPSPAALAGDAVRSAALSVRRLPAALTAIAHAATQLRPSLLRRVPATSLNRPTGDSRRFVVLSGRLSAMSDSARAAGATVNDLVLAAVAGALRDLLVHRGETLDTVVLSVPFSGRRDDETTDQLGNHSGAIPIRVPTAGDPRERLARIADSTRRLKGTMRGASTALLGPMFRLVARVSLFQWFIDRQRIVQSFVTNVRGPAAPLALGSLPVRAIIPLTVAVGNVTVSFAVMSYAGAMTITIVADPETCPDTDLLAVLLAVQLLVFTGERWAILE